MATDLLKTKIDDWELSTGDFEESVLSSAGITRSVSDTGPRRTMDSATLYTKSAEPVKECPVIQIGRPSDDVFGVEADGFVGERAAALTKKISQKEIAEWIWTQERVLVFKVEQMKRCVACGWIDETCEWMWMEKVIAFIEDGTGSSIVQHIVNLQASMLMISQHTLQQAKLEGRSWRMLKERHARLCQGTPPTSWCFGPALAGGEHRLLALSCPCQVHKSFRMKFYDFPKMPVPASVELLPCCFLDLQFFSFFRHDDCACVLNCW
jgi:hypothetical protein